MNVRGITVITSMIQGKVNNQEDLGFAVEFVECLSRGRVPKNKT